MYFCENKWSFLFVTLSCISRSDEDFLLIQTHLYFLDQLSVFPTAGSPLPTDLMELPIAKN